MAPPQAIASHLHFLWNIYETKKYIKLIRIGDIKLSPYYIHCRNFIISTAGLFSYTMHIFSPQELAFLRNPDKFSKDYQKVLRYRIRKKVREVQKALWVIETYL